MVKATNKHSEKPVFGIEYNNGYHGSLPRFHELKEFPQFKVLVESWEEIKRELFAHEKFKSLKTDRSSTEEGWKGMYLNNYGIIYDSNVKQTDSPTNYQ